MSEFFEGLEDNNLCDTENRTIGKHSKEDWFFGNVDMGRQPTIALVSQ